MRRRLQTGALLVPRRCHPRSVESGPRVRLGIGLAVAINLLGCSVVDDTADRGGTSIEQRDGHSGGTTKDWEPWRVSSTPTVVIGESSGVEYELAQVTAAFRYSQGFVVATALPVSIRLFDEEGQFQRQVGREGEGPGEYRSVRRTWAAGGDTIIAFDFMLRRINYYDASGEFSRLVPFDAGGSHVVGEERPKEIVDRFSDGSFLTRQTIYPPQPAKPPEEISNSLARLRREMPAAGVQDTITTTLDLDLAFWVEAGTGWGIWRAVPFTHSTSAIAWDTLLVVADNRRFEVQLWSFEPRMIARFTKEYETLPITDKTWSAELDRRLDRFLTRIESTNNRQNLNVPGELAAIRSGFRDETRLESLPVHGRRMLVDEEGNVWIEAWADDQTIASPSWHILLAESRQFVGPIELPPRFRPTAIYRDSMVGVQKNELDVESVRVYPILK